MRNVAAWANSDREGRSWLSFFRKVPASAATIAGQWFDYATAGGVPVPNYYASTPLAAATLDRNAGIYVPPLAAGGKRYLKNTIVMSAAASNTTTGTMGELLNGAGGGSSPGAVADAVWAAAIRTLTSIGTVNANITAVNGVTIRGSGTTPDPWGPA